MVKNKKPKQQQKQSLRLLLLLDDTDSRNNRVMSQLRDSLLSQLTELHPTLPPSVLTRRSSFIQSRLQHLFHSFHTPTHPPYALVSISLYLSLSLSSIIYIVNFEFNFDIS
jgi:hypothetical protein